MTIFPIIPNIKLVVQEKLLKEAAIIAELWKNEPMLKKQKVPTKQKRFRKVSQTPF